MILLINWKLGHALAKVNLALMAARRVRSVCDDRARMGLCTPLAPRDPWAEARILVWGWNA